jgi:ribonuclease HI
MLDLPPVPAVVKKEAVQSAFRILDSFKPSARDMQGHLKIYKDFQGVMDQHALSDRMPIRYDFEAPFKVKIYEQSVLTYYTDGSRKDGMTGMGIYGPSLRYYETLGSSATIFQAEMYAINVCARIWLSTEGLTGKHVYIMSDSQAALSALQSYTFTSKLVAECLNNLKRLTSKCKVTLLWVPGHTGIDGNEEADQLAN